jgi:serine/threonine-protein kinase
MGAVYLASDVAHARPVAVKILDPSLGAAIGADRFAREVQLTAQLQHPHICALYDSGEIRAPDGSAHLWFAMPYLAGGSLADRIRRDGPLPMVDAVRIAREAATGLAFAHRQGVLHRDVKPGNILLSVDGHVQVADFGIARAMAPDSVFEVERLTQTGISLGTPAYMSPEQAMGDRSVDARTDVYALGAVLYEMLVGEPPYSGPTAQAIIARQLTEPPRSLGVIRAEVSGALEEIVLSMLQRDPAERIADMEAVERALDASVSGASDNRSGAKTLRAGRRASRRWMVFGTLMAIVLAGGVVTAVALRRRSETTSTSGGPPAIAVLPFENQGEASDEYFADGMTDAIRGSLAELPELRVIGRNTSQSYKGTKRLHRDIARELGARYLVTGTVRWAHRAGATDEVEVRPELVEIASDAEPIVRWDRPVDAPLTDVFKVQGEIASQVASALNLVLTRGVETRLATPLTRSMPAYLAYLKGEAATARSFDPRTQEEAAADYRQAIGLDTGFVQAWARLARSYAIAYFTGSQDAAVGDSSRWAAERAIQLGPDNAAAAEALARYYGLVKLDPDRALVEITRARKLAPSDGDIAMFTGLMEQFRGDPLVGVRDLEAAHRLDPRSSRTTYNLASLYLTLRRYADAEALITTARAAFPDAPEFWQLAIQLPLQQGNLDSVHALIAHNKLTDRELELVTLGTYGWMYALTIDDASRDRLLALGPDAFNGDVALLRIAQAMIYTARRDSTRAHQAAGEAVERLAPASRASTPDPTRLLMFGEALAYAGRRAEAMEVATRVLSLPMLVRHAYMRDIVQQGVALIYTRVGQQDKAIDLLDTLLRRNDYPLTTAWLRTDPTLAPLRGNARFERLIAQQ